VPKNRFPLPKSERPVKALAFVGATLEPLRPALAVRPSADTDEPPSSSLTTFYLDSGAGQCLCSCSSAFVSMEACHLQVVGMAGRLTIYGQGTAIFLASLDGREFLLRIHNCLHSYGEFNLISVSQLKLVSGNSVNFSVHCPFVRFSRSQSERLDSLAPDFIEMALNIDDGLYSLSLEPVTPSDPRFSELPMYDVTLPGQFCPLNRSLSAVVENTTLAAIPVWTTEILSSSPTSGRVLVLNSGVDFDDELRIFSDQFLAPAAIRPSGTKTI
jgi:hypothetical protein